MRARFLLLGIAGLFAAGCSSSSNPVTTTPVDAGVADAAPAIDAAVPAVDAGSDADTRPPSSILSADTIDFGLADCGGAAPPDQMIGISNQGGGSLTWYAMLDSNSTAFSIVGATSGSINPDEGVQVTVHANPIAATSSAGAGTNGTLVIVTNDESRPTTFVPLTVKASGGTLTLTPQSAVFGQTPVGAPAPDISLSLTNTGNAPITLAFTQPTNTAFTLAAPTSVTVMPGQSVPSLAAQFNPTDETLDTASASIQVTGAVCGKSVATISMTGQGESGVVAVSPGQLDFGKTNCGAQAGDQVFTLSNMGDAPFSWTASLGKGAESPFIVPTSGGTLLPNVSTQIQVVPSRIPQASSTSDNFYGDNLTVRTSVANDADHVIVLKQTAQGIVLTASTTSLDFKQQSIADVSPALNVTLTNAGNAPAHITASVDNTAFASTIPSTIEAGTSGTLGATVTPIEFGPADGTLSVASTDVLCAPLPASIAMTGAGYGHATQVVGGANHTCALIEHGLVGCWGYDYYGQLGDGVMTQSIDAQVPQPTPKIVTGISGATAIAAGSQHTCVIAADKSVKCWGSNSSGALGNGQTTDSSTPVAAGLSNVTKIAAGNGATCAITTGGNLYCWGNNGNGQLGNGGTNQTSTPTLVSLPAVTNVSVNQNHACATVAGGMAYCWGYDQGGDIGQAGTCNSYYAQYYPQYCAQYTFAWNFGSYSTPTVVPTLTATSTVLAGGSHSCALNTDGSVRCFGFDDVGELGTGTVPPITVPTPQLIPSYTVKSLYVGTNDSCGVDANGALTCWGQNYYGQLSAGSSTVLTPTAIPSVKSVTSVGLGDQHSCAVDSTGVSCWGSNSQGQLGTGNTQNSSSPAAVLYFQ
jgi:alpha-tubulin suppressor-like RCC1 family protein